MQCKLLWWYFQSEISDICWFLVPTSEQAWWRAQIQAQQMERSEWPNCDRGHAPIQRERRTDGAVMVVWTVLHPHNLLWEVEWREKEKRPALTVLQVPRPPSRLLFPPPSLLQPLPQQASCPIQCLLQWLLPKKGPNQVSPHWHRRFLQLQNSICEHQESTALKKWWVETFR